MAKKLEVLIVGNTSSLERSFNKAGQEAGLFGGKLNSLAGPLTNLKSQAMAAGAGLIAGFAFKDVIGETVDLGSSVKTLQRQLGDTAEDASVWAFAAKRFGIESATMGMAVKTLAKDVANGGEKLAKYGISARDAQGNVRPFTDIMGDAAEKAQELGPGLEADALAADLFGRGGMALLPVLLQGRDGFEGLREKAEEAGLVMSQEGVDAVTKYKFAVKDLTEKLDGIKVKIGLDVMPWLTTLTNYLENNLIPVLWSVAAVVGVVTTSMAVNFAVKTASSVASIYRVVSALGVLGAAGTVSGLAGIASILETIAIGAMVAWEAIAGSAVVVAIISALETAVLAVSVALGVSIGAAAAIVVAIVAAVIAVIGGLIYWFTHFGEVNQAVSSAVGAAWEWLGGIFGTAKDTIVNHLYAAWRTISNFAAQVPERARAAGAAILNAIVGELKQLPYQVGFVIGYAAGTIVRLLIDAANGVRAAGAAIVGALVGAITALPGIASGIFWSVVNTVVGAISSVIGWLAGAIPQIPGIVGSGLAALPGIASGAFWAVVNAAYGAMSALTGAVWAGIGAAAGAMAALPGQLLAALGDLGGLLYDAGQQVVQGLINGITSMAGAAWDAISNLGSGLKDGFTSALGISSPSKDFAKLGEYINQGLAIGINRTSGLAVSAMSGVASAIKAPMASPTMATASTGGNSYSFDIQINGATNPEATADAVYRRIMSKLERNVRLN